jgi:hypothetical protein
MLQTYTTCVNTPGNSDQYCAAYDECLYENGNNVTICSGDISQYYNPNWVSGNCGEQ